MRYFTCLLLLLTLPIAAHAQAYSLNDDLIYRLNFGNADDVKILLDKGADPNSRTQDGETALSIALDRNDKETMKMAVALLAKGANPNVQDRTKNYPIITAAKNGQNEIVAALIAAGANYRVLSSTGTPLLDVAKASGNADIIKTIRDAAGKEQADAARLRTPERFHEIIRQYSYNSCYYQYWSYFLSSRQDPDRNTEVEKKVSDSKAALSQLLEQIQKYYPSTPSGDLQRITDTSAGTVFADMDKYISNRNRADHGIGNAGDSEARCNKIADGTHLEFIPEKQEP